jgi:four helix bundle protein
VTRRREGEEPRDIAERAFRFAVRVVRLCEHLDHRPGVTRLLARQLFRSGTSIGANLQEARAGQSRADFLSKCNIALKEARETLYWLRLAEATELVLRDRLLPLMEEADELVAILTTIVKRTRDAPRGRETP